MIKLFKFDNYEDYRGKLSFSNELDLTLFKRVYFIEHNDLKTRAWQGHITEHKVFIVLEGSFKIGYIKVKDFTSPPIDEIPDFKVLTAKNKEAIYLPEGYANGIKNIKKNSKLLVLSNLVVEDSLKDNVRYDSSLWEI